MSLSEDRLAEIRERATCPSAKESAFLAADECLYSLIEDDVPDLLAEVDRLTAENTRLRERLDDAVDYCDNMAHDYEAGYVARAVLALLNPPTEGETDDHA